MPKDLLFLLSTSTFHGAACAYLSMSEAGPASAGLGPGRITCKPI